MIGRQRRLSLVEHSPLRKADPRTKLFVGVMASLMVMMPIQELAVFLGIYVLFLVWARLLKPAVQQAWRLKWILLFLFIIDWVLISLDHAILVCARLILLAGVFTLFFSTTTNQEFGLALEKLGLPYRYAFSLGLAFQSLGLLDDEWRTILEAQTSRGAFEYPEGLRGLISKAGNLISLTVPAIVLTTKRAWTVTEAAHARGFDAPHRKSYRTLSFTWFDGALALGTTIVLSLLIWIDILEYL
jgi:energy-coupling factor transporter transmembrane protein EcfT